MESTMYIQTARAEVLVPIVDRLADDVGLEGWKAGTTLDAESADAVIRLDNTNRLRQGLDTVFDHIELRFNAYDVYAKQEPKSEHLVRVQLEAKVRARVAGFVPAS